MLFPSGCCIGIQGRTNKFPSGRRWRDQYQIGPNEQLMRSGHDDNSMSQATSRVCGQMVEAAIEIEQEAWRRKDDAKPIFATQRRQEIRTVSSCFSMR